MFSSFLRWLFDAKHLFYRACYDTNHFLGKWNVVILKFLNSEISKTIFKSFRSKLSPTCFHMFSCFPGWLCDDKTPFLLETRKHLKISSQQFSAKIIWDVFAILRSEISKLRHFICPKNGFFPTSRWCKTFLEVLWRQTKIPWKMRHWAFQRTNSRVHSNSEKKRPFFEKKRSRVHPLK